MMDPMSNPAQLRLTAWGVTGIGEIKPGDQLGDVIVDACRAEPNGPLADGDVLVVTQKIVSKAEGRMVEIDPTDPLSHKVLVEQEGVRVVRRRGDLIITETTHGFICANSGIDLSNVERGGRTMQVTEVAVADELASAAELVMGKSSGIPVAVVRGADPGWFRDSSVGELVRPASEDLFR